MVQNLSQSGNTSSPSANMLGLGTPSGLGIGGVTPAGFDVLTPALGGAQMMHTMSDLGLTPSGGKRNEDEERRMKMRKVLKSIGRDKGRVSEEGIARVARRVGFANDIDAEKLTPEEKERKVGNRPISTAGNAIVVEIDLKNQVPRGVQVVYSTQTKALDEHGAKAGTVLMNDLKAPGGVSLNAKLDRFALNLERLARMDRLSAGGINCFEAVSGLYASLERLYEQEKGAVKALLGPEISNIEEKADVEVMCKKSGKPLVHADGKIGIEIAYWQDNRHINSTKQDRQTGTEMEIDGQDDKEGDHGNEDQDQVFKLRIEVESCSANLYPPLRVSDAWVPDPLELPAADSGEGIPWQDPNQTYTSPNGVDNGSMVHGQLPDLRFIARLDPPIVVPTMTAVNIQNALGTPAVYSTFQQYAEMLLGSAVPLGQQKSFTISAKQSVLSYKDGEETTVQHLYKLENSRPDFGTRIEQLPFSHPRQLVELLPTLRQWACVGSLLKATLSNHQEDNVPAASNGVNGTTSDANDDSELNDSLMTMDTGPTDAIQVNISLATAPTPSLGITFPTSSAIGVANINIEIEANADIAVTNRESILADDSAIKTEAMRQQEQRLAKALDVCADLGVWVEWVRSQSSS